MFQVRTFDPKTLKWWFDEKENIDMSPPFQRRGGIWSDHDKAYLIDSILNGYDIPKFYIADFSYYNSGLNISKKSYAVIDGKQRFEAIFSFFTGKLVLNEDFYYGEDASLQLGGLSYQDLKSQHPTLARRFDNFAITVMSVITDEESRINELFIRLNRSKPLVGAELRSAMAGVVPRLINRLSAHNLFQQKIRFSVARKQDHETAAKILLIEFRGKFVDVKKTHLDRFVQEGIESLTSTEHFAAAAERATRVLDAMSTIFIDRDPLLTRSAALHVYYWFVRSHLDQDPGAVRDFLVTFERERTQNARNAKLAGIETQHPVQVDGELLHYDVLNLSPNDQGSSVGRYNILEMRFKRYLENQIVALRILETDP